MVLSVYIFPSQTVEAMFCFHFAFKEQNIQIAQYFLKQKDVEKMEMFSKIYPLNYNPWHFILVMQNLLQNKSIDDLWLIDYMPVLQYFPWNPMNNCHMVTCN